MKTLHYSIIAILIFSMSLYLKPIQADNENGVVIQNIQTLPTTIIIGQTFKINATLVNNSSKPIFVEHGSCGASFSVTFDNHVVVRTNGVNCTLELIEQRLDPGTKITSTSPYLDLTYVAAQNGTVNATVSFPYNVWNQTAQSNTPENISKQFSFTIYPKTRVPTLSPSGNQAIIDVALSIPDLQKWSNDWQFDSMAFMTAKNQPGNWQYAIVYLKASSSSSIIPCDSNNDWSAMVMIDRTTMKVIQATYPTVESHNCNYTTGGGPIGGGPNTYGDTTPKMDTPLQQFKSGIAAKDVTCEQGLQLVIKSEDNSPACIRSVTAQKLIERGWAKEIVTNTSVESSTLNKTTANELKIDLSNQTYDAGYPVYVNLKGVNQDSTCKIPSISVRDESDQSIVYGPTPDRSYVGGCADPWPITFYAGLEKNTLITKSTRYSILATLDNKTYQKEFTVILSLYSNKNITADSTQIMPGYLTFTSCLPVSDVPNNGTLISYTGFDMYRRYLAGPDTGGIPEIDDYLLKPGSTGSFVLQVHQGQFSKDANLAGGLYFLSENLLNLDNSTVLNNKPLASEEHPGLVLSYTPSFAKVGPEGYATITASISAQQNATRGTYWLYLPPGICGGDRVLLTIGEQPLAQPSDYIGYDLASHFAQGVGNPAQSDVTFELINAGIHTFENCSVNYVSNNQTITIKTFNVIPPGMEYKYHANLTSTSKISGFLECKNPPITKVYPDVWVDVIPY